MTQTIPSQTPGTNPEKQPITIKKRHDFLAANRGWRHVTSGFILIIYHRKDGHADWRIGYTVSKKTGNAVTRNRIKRRLRAAVQQVFTDQAIAGADHIIIARKGADIMDFGEILGGLQAGIARYRRKYDGDRKRSGHNTSPSPDNQAL